MQADPHIHNQQRDAHQQEAQRRLFPLRRLSNPRGRVVDRRSQRSHCWDHVTPLEETLSTPNDLVRGGKLRYLGASNYTGWQLQKAIDLSRRGMAAPPPGSRVEIAEEQGWGESWSAYNNESTWRVVDALLAVAEDAGKTPAQVALNWLLGQPGVTAPIIGARTAAQLDANLGAGGWALSDAQAEQLNQASAAPLPYPYEHVTRAELRR